MRRFLPQACLAIIASVLVVASFDAGQPAATPLRFEVTVADNLMEKPQDGRLLIVLGRSAKQEPRKSIGTGKGAREHQDVLIGGCSGDKRDAIHARDIGDRFEFFRE